MRPAWAPAGERAATAPVIVSKEARVRVERRPGYLRHTGGTSP